MPYDRRSYWLAKEPGYFCSELIARPNLAVNGPREYLRLFSAATDQLQIGEASALYLYSQQAAQRIQQFCPTAKIIALIREPVAMMRSWHADNLRHGHDDVTSFERAIELEEPRRNGKSLPFGSGYPACLQYRAMATFSQQIERYLQQFRRNQVKVLLLEDLATAPQKTLGDVLQFLDLSPDCSLDQVVHNQRVGLSQGDLLKQKAKNWLRGFGAVRLARRVLPFNLDRCLDLALRPMMSRTPVQSSPDPGFLADLHQQMRPEVERLSEVIHRDLSHWFSPLQAHTVPSPHLTRQRERKVHVSGDE